MNDKAYEKRFSEHPMLWIICGAGFVSIHIFIYLRIVAAAGEGIISFVWLAWSIVMMLVLYLSIPSIIAGIIILSRNK